MSIGELKLPIPAARVIVVDSENRVLLLKRQNTDYGDGQWCLPGGKVEYGQTIEQAAARELEEETSLEAKSLEFMFYQDNVPEKPGDLHYINFYFKCVASGSVKINEESSDYRWIPASELANYSIAFRNDAALSAYWEIYENSS
jgi:8-oxo-dGTP diphosphatase